MLTLPEILHNHKIFQQLYLKTPASERIALDRFAVDFQNFLSQHNLVINDEAAASFIFTQWHKHSRQLPPDELKNYTGDASQADQSTTAITTTRFNNDRTYADVSQLIIEIPLGMTLPYITELLLLGIIKLFIPDNAFEVVTQLTQLASRMLATEDRALAWDEYGNLWEFTRASDAGLSFTIHTCNPASAFDALQVLALYQCGIKINTINFHQFRETLIGYAQAAYNFENFWNDYKQRLPAGIKITELSIIASLEPEIILSQKIINALPKEDGYYVCHVTTPAGRLALSAFIRVNHQLIEEVNMILLDSTSQRVDEIFHNQHHPEFRRVNIYVPFEQTEQTYIALTTEQLLNAWAKILSDFFTAASKESSATLSDLSSTSPQLTLADQHRTMRRNAFSGTLEQGCGRYPPPQTFFDAPTTAQLSLQHLSGDKSNSTGHELNSFPGPETAMIRITEQREGKNTIFLNSLVNYIEHTYPHYSLQISEEPTELLTEEELATHFAIQCSRVLNGQSMIFVSNLTHKGQYYTVMANYIEGKLTAHFFSDNRNLLDALAQSLPGIKFKLHLLNGDNSWQRKLQELSLPESEPQMRM